MLYCQGYTVSFQEVPDEVSLVFLIADCPHRCPGCHSPSLREQTGEDLEVLLPQVIAVYRRAVSCVCFMGEGRDKEAMERCARYVKSWGLRTAIYQGLDGLGDWDFTLFDYIKFGPYIESRGGLDKPTTNQVMMRIECDPENVIHFVNITPKFWHKESAVVSI